MSPVMHVKWLTIFLAVCGGMSSFAAQAQSYASGNVNMVRTEWNADQFGVVLDTPVQNPANCPSPDGYVTDATQPGYDSFYEAALGAYKIGAPITVVVGSTAGACVSCAHRP